jgi:hypothetical protein
MNKKLHGVGCEYIHTMVNSCELTVYHTAGVRRELHDEFIAAYNREPAWSTKAFVSTVPNIEHHNVVCSGISPDEFRTKHPREWTEQAVITLEEATEAYTIEVIAASHC